MLDLLFVHAGQCGATLPEQQSRTVVLGLPRRHSRGAPVEVLARRLGHVWRRCEVDNRFCAHGRRYREKLGEPNEARDQGAALVAETSSDEPRMQAIRNDARAMQAASELTREQDVA